MTLVDLTMPLGPATPSYPGDPRVQVAVAAEFGRDGYLTHELRLGSHHGTHLDAAAHLLPGGRTLEGYPLEQFVGPGRLVEVRGGPGPDALAAAGVGAGDIVLLRSGISDAPLTADYYDRVPDIPVTFAEQLVRLGVKLVGIDAGSIDAPPYPVHRILLAGGVLIAENLVGLSRLVDTSFEVWALPLRLDVDGAPARVVARVT